MAMRKVLALVILLGIVFSLLVGCVQSKTNPTEISSDSSNNSGETSQVPTQEDLGSKLSKDPIVLSWNYFIASGTPFREDMPVWTEIAKKTNISLKNITPASAVDFDATFGTMMASGEIPDIVTANKKYYNKYGKEGAFVPLNKLIEENAPNITKLFNERPEIKKFVTASDGNIYFIPNVPDGKAAEGWFIRKDWLDKLGLDIPKSAEEFYNAMVAFKTKDPNGNGKSDEIPFFARSWWECVDVPAMLTGLESTTLYPDANGKIVHGLYSDPAKAKAAYAYAAKWYAEGITDREIFTRGDTRADFFGEKNIGGFTHDWFPSTSTHGANAKNKVPGFELIPILPPAGLGGVVREYTQRETVSSDYGWAISSSDKYPVETIKFFDYFFSDEGRRMMNFGIEGVNYDMKDGAPVFKDYMIHDKQKSVQDMVDDIRGVAISGYLWDVRSEIQGMNELGQQGTLSYENSNNFGPRLPVLDYNDLEQSVIGDTETAINKYLDEAKQKFVTGAWTVDKDFDTYLNGLKKLGMDRYIQVQQAAYDRYMQ